MILYDDPGVDNVPCANEESDEQFNHALDFYDDNIILDDNIT